MVKLSLALTALCATSVAAFAPQQGNQAFRCVRTGTLLCADFFFLSDGGGGWVAWRMGRKASLEMPNNMCSVAAKMERCHAWHGSEGIEIDFRMC